MGGCATKLKVLKDESEPEPEPELETETSKIVDVDETNVTQEAEPEINTGVDDDQTNKRRSLSLLFNKESDDTEASTKNVETAVEEIVKQETLEAQKPLEDSKSNEPIVKLESSKAEENQPLKNEPVEQDSPLLIKLEEKSSVQNESNKPHEEIVKVESKIEKLLEENQIRETPKQELVDAKDTPSHGSKSDKPETLIEETKVTKVATQPEKKLIETLSTNSVSVPKIITDKATFGSKEEKNHNKVEHASKGSDASNIKT